MKKPKSPPKGKVLVLTNSFFKEWSPDIVPMTFNSVAEAEKWITTKLTEEPGDLYVVCSIESLSWASIKIHKTRKS